MSTPEWPASALPAATGAVQTVRCTVLLPAYNEELVLGNALRSLQEQTRPPDRILVIADNCTDTTVQVAREHGVDVVETVGNTEKKAGALNQQLRRLLPGQRRARRHPGDGCRLHHRSRSSSRTGCAGWRRTRRSWPSVACSTASPATG